MAGERDPKLFLPSPPPAQPQGTRGEAVDGKDRGKGSWGGWGSKNWALLEKWSEISRGEGEKT